jgi:hypothetical protein
VGLQWVASRDTLVSVNKRPTAADYCRRADCQEAVGSARRQIRFRLSVVLGSGGHRLVEIETSITTPISDATPPKAIKPTADAIDML